MSQVFGDRVSTLGKPYKEVVVYDKEGLVVFSAFRFGGLDWRSVAAMANENDLHLP